MTRTMRLLLILLMAVLDGVAFAPSASAGTTADPTRRVLLPLTVAIDESLREQLEEIVAVSPTLQCQFDAIADAPVVVEVRVSLVPLPGLRRAETTISRYDSGFMRARIHVPSGIDFVELFAHELEHVVEQIEGVDLSALARAGSATRDSDGSFETVRARDAGRAAATEVDQARALKPAH